MKKTILYIIFSIALTPFLFASAQTQFHFDLANLEDQGLADITAYENIKIIDAWNLLEQESLTPVTIGIFDTGIDKAHPEFDGVDIVTSSSIDHHEGGHGTQVAGIIGANNISFDNAYVPPQMNGILSGVRDFDYTLQMRFASAFSGFTLEDGFRHFVILDQLARSPDGIQVINGSFGVPLCSELPVPQRILRKLGDLSCYGTLGEFTAGKDIYTDLVAQYPDTLFIFSAGNDGMDAQFHLPGGGVNALNAIAVAATDLNDGRADFGFLASASNFGLSVDIAAPGVEVYAPKPGNGYRFFGGTSASAPMVTGVAGLLKAIDPSLTPAQIKNILIETADPLFADDLDERNKKLGPVDPVTDLIHCNPLNLPFARGCRLNALRAVQAVLPSSEPCILSGTLSTDTTLRASQSPCTVQGTLTIPSGITLTIDPGVVIKFASISSNLIVNGTLNAQGTPSQPIFFTSIKDDTVGGDTNNDGSLTSPARRDWKRIFISTTGTANFTHSTIRYGGAGGGFGEPSAGIISEGTLSFISSHLTQNFDNLVVRGGTTTIISSEIDTADFGIQHAGGSVTVSQSSIHDHSVVGIAASSTPTDAVGNWWGSASGPFHATLNPSGLGDRVSDNVDFIPFLTTDPVGSLP